MAKHTVKILRCEHRKIIKVYLAILQHYGLITKGKEKYIAKINMKLDNVQAAPRTYLSNVN